MILAYSIVSNGANLSTSFVMTYDYVECKYGSHECNTQNHDDNGITVE